MRCVVAILGLLCSAVMGSAQGQSDAAAFDVVSVKRRAREERPVGGAPRVMAGGRFLAPAVTVEQLIATAYELLSIQIIDAPRWTREDRFDIEARTAPAATAPQVRAMIRTLLADRFGFAAHTESRELSVYLMRTANADGQLGRGLRPSGPECRDLTMPPNAPLPPPPPPPPPGETPALFLGGPPARCLVLFVTMASSSHMTMRELTMDTFARRLTAQLGRLVIDRTGLKGFFDVDLTYVSESQALSSTSDSPTILTAVREQLGLRLDSTREAVNVLVIDRVEPPTQN